MPKYDYKCEDCGKVVEKTRRMAERTDKAVCVGCGGLVEIVFSTQCELITPARWQYDKVRNVREVTGGHSMNDIKYNAELRKKML